MLKRTFEKLSLEVPVLGLGCMRLPTLENGEIDCDAGFEMVDYAMSNGIKYFDTAYMYHNYKSEIFAGEALKKYPRDSFFLASKLPLQMFNLINNKEDMQRIFDEQLEKCQVEYFDFYLVHCLDRNKKNSMKNLSVREFLEEKKQQGKIKHIGFSFHDSPEHFKYFVDNYDWDFVQVQINFLDWTVQSADEIYKTIEEKNLPCIIMEPLRGGMLAALPDYALKILEENNVKNSSANLALRWATQFKNVKVILSGMSNLVQIKENIETFTDYKEITEHENNVLKKVSTALENSKAILCTGCGYCTYACPQGIEIPYIFELYNRRVMFKEYVRVKHYYHQLIEQDKKASACRFCGNCMPQCPQGLSIIELLVKADEEFNK